LPEPWRWAVDDVLGPGGQFFNSAIHSAASEPVRATPLLIRYAHRGLLHCRRSGNSRGKGDMDENIPLSGQIDLDALDDYLISDHAPDNIMGLSDLDGFLTGVVVGPELILPSEWLPVIWGGDEPEFQTEAEMRTVLGTIMGRYNEIVTCLDSEPEDFEPIFMVGPDDEMIASDWAAGFLDAVALRWKAWEPLITHDRAGIMMLPILLLNGEAELDAGPNGTIDKEAFLAEAPAIIPGCIVGIHNFWTRKRTHRKPRTGKRRSHAGRRRLH
jgi:uncharacterized protein